MVAISSQYGFKLWMNIAGIGYVDHKLLAFRLRPVKKQSNLVGYTKLRHVLEQK